MIVEIFAIIFAVSLTLGLLYGISRFGSVIHGWVKLSKEQIDSMNAAHKGYVATHPRMRPDGPPLFKRKMVSHAGVAIYKNGIYAKFCIGIKGKYRFIPWSEVSDIYPVRIENPFSKKDSIWTGPASFKAIQIETENSMVLLVTSKEHDFETLIPAMKQAMGPWWNHAYRENETLWGNFLEGDLLIHRSLRKTGMPRPGKTESFAMPPPKPAVQGKGRLLLEESQEDVRERAGAFVRGGILLIALGAAVAVVGLALMRMGLASYLQFMFVMLVFLGPMFTVLGGVILAISRKLKPVRIYDNGIEASAPMGTRTFFFSFGELQDVTETRNFIDGEVYVFKTGAVYQNVAIRKRMRGFPEMLPAIRAKLGREEYVVKDVSPREAVASRKTEYVLYATATIVSIVISAVFILYAFSGQSASVAISGFGIVMPLFTMLAVTYMTFRMTKMHKVVPRRLNIKIPAAIVALSLAYFFVSLGVGFAIPASSPQPTDTHIEPKPISSSLPPGTYVGAVLTLNSSILVDSGQVLQLVNTTLVMDLSADRQSGIWVGEGGTLLMSNTTISAAQYSFRYTFEIMGSARIEGGTISGVWANSKQENFDGGLEIYSSDVVINGTSLPDPWLSGVLIMNSSPTITNNTITGAGDDGIEMHDSKARVVGNTISHCDYAMIVSQGSDALIENNVFADNRHGIVLQSSSPVVRLNWFENNENYAIMYDSQSRLNLEGNTYVNNEHDLVEESGLYILSACGVVTVALAVACLLVLFWIYKEQLRKDQDQLGQFGRLKEP